ncbi:MAG: Zn-dependent hydrolase [Gloeocapsa sp. DLM2.Bin57]|nr:MAG: Zn-dependent hydrolase [Gloeocapsa sp. DLM2.Bin57]
MERRKFLIYTAASLATIISWQGYQAQTPNNSVTIEWLGHMSFLFRGEGIRVLVNPFATLGCTAGYRLPRVEADLVLLSSFLLDEGSAEDLPGNPQVLYEPGDYQYQGIRFQGIGIPHDREGGRRFGTNVAWSWTMGGLRILHLGGAAAPLGIEERILMGSPDILLVPVGGGPKAYNPSEAIEAISVLNPRIIIPTQYLTPAADPLQCDLVNVDEFLNLANDSTIQRLNTNQITISTQNLPTEGSLIKVFNYQNLLTV